MSHSTLADVSFAAGQWPVRRRLGRQGRGGERGCGGAELLRGVGQGHAEPHALRLHLALQVSRQIWHWLKLVLLLLTGHFCHRPEQKGPDAAWPCVPIPASLFQPAGPDTAPVCAAELARSTWRRFARSSAPRNACPSWVSPGLIEAFVQNCLTVDCGQAASGGRCTRRSRPTAEPSLRKQRERPQ